jgi:TRAP-type mannitol/chloroaromatic compound transport system permease small subunit
MSESKHKNIESSTAIMAFAVFPLVGFVCFLIPQLFLKDIDLTAHSSSILELVAYSYKKVVLLPTMALLALSGIRIGFVVKRLCVFLGMSSILVFPSAAIYEMVKDPFSHNLWPFEFIMYFAFSIPAIVGACIGKKIAERKKGL